MFGRNDIWGGPLEIHPEDPSEDDENNDRRRDLDMAAYRPPSLDEVKQSWLLRPEEYAKKKKKKTIHKNKVFRTLLAVALLVGLIVLIVKVVPRPRHKLHLSASENYTIALHQALMFFNAQKSGRLPKDNNVSWRGDSGLKDELLGGYYDGGDESKFTFPASFAMTMLSWSVLEYRAKYEAIGELSHVKSIIKWGTDYLLKTFDSSANSTDKIASHIGVGTKENCWTRPEDIDTKRPAFECSTCPALAAETAAALAAASMVFKDDIKYSKKLVHGANIVFKFATKGEAVKYAGGSDQSSPFYNSSGYSDEFLWGGTWLYYATGNSSYLKLVTTPLLTNLSQQGRDQSVLSWDNKLPGAKLLLTRLRMFLSLGYPYEEMLGKFHRQINDIMCSYLPDFPTFKRTKGGLINLNNGKPRPLQYVVNAAFLATLYSDYLDSISQSGWSCGPDSYPREKLLKFARTQINYILGKNPQSMSYVVGFGDRFPQHVHHRGASIPSNKKKYGCEGGRKWRDSGKANPNIIVGAMVAGPDKTGSFHDVRSNYNYTEPTIAGNAGLVVALVALLGERPAGIDKNSMFYAIPPLTSLPPPPPSPWIPRL